MRLRRTHPDTPRPFRVPGGRTGVWAAAGLATAWCALAGLAALVPGLGTADPDAALPAGFAGERLAFTASIVVPLVALAATALAISLALPALRRRRAAADCDPTLPVRCEP